MAGDLEYDRIAELKAFDETKAGVKGLVDAGVKEVPRIFFHPKVEENKNSYQGDERTLPELPVIDMDGIGTGSTRRRGEITDKLRDASEKLGFFQVLNHGIPTSVLEEMHEGARRFFEQDVELKKPWFTRDMTKRVVYNSNYDLYTKPSIDWRDTLTCVMAPNILAPEDLPHACSEILVKYTEGVKNLGGLLLELLSEGLGLDPNYLKEKDRAEGLVVLCHYYPACPQPELTMGTIAHTDSPFITVLLQDHIPGLQILHQDRWIDIPHTPGALFVNIGDRLQLISSGKYKSVFHRVVSNKVGPRISVASFFTTRARPIGIFKPVKELVPDENETDEGIFKVTMDVIEYYQKKKEDK